MGNELCSARIDTPKRRTYTKPLAASSHQISVAPSKFSQLSITVAGPLGSTQALGIEVSE
jgi:hypothetical protein